MKLVAFDELPDTDKNENSSKSRWDISKPVLVTHVEHPKFGSA